MSETDGSGSDTTDPVQFEKALEELERLVEQMEQGDLPLEESLRSFERGVSLTRHCQKALQEAEQKVEILTRQDGEDRVEPFEPESD